MFQTEFSSLENVYTLANKSNSEKWQKQQQQKEIHPHLLGSDSLLAGSDSELEGQ